LESSSGSVAIRVVLDLSGSVFERDDLFGSDSCEMWESFVFYFTYSFEYFDSAKCWFERTSSIEDGVLRETSFFLCRSA